METRTFKIQYKYGDVIKIKPLGDIHLGNTYCDKRKLGMYLSESDESTYFLGIGDLLDNIVVTDPRYTKHVDDTPSGTIIDDQIETMAEILLPYKDKILGLGRGNHEDVIIKKCGTDPIKRLCKKLECSYLGLSGLVRLNLTENGNRGRNIIIRYHHGWGGGSRTQGADLTKFSKDMMYWDADIYLYGHVHRKQSDRIPRLGLIGDKLVSKPKLLGICGTFLRTYTDTTDSTYSELKGYPPVEIGGITVNLKPTNDWLKMWIDI